MWNSPDSWLVRAIWCSGVSITAEEEEEKKRKRRVSSCHFYMIHGVISIWLRSSDGLDWSVTKPIVRKDWWWMMDGWWWMDDGWWMIDGENDRKTCDDDVRFGYWFPFPFPEFFSDIMNDIRSNLFSVWECVLLNSLWFVIESHVHLCWWSQTQALIV